MMATNDAIRVRGPVLAAQVARWLAALKPRRRMTLSQWANSRARLEDGTRYRPFPFQVGIQDAFTDPEVRQISVLKASRIGYSQIVKNFIAYCADQAPSRVLVYQPTIDDAEDFAKDDIAKLIAWPAVRRLFSTKTRDSNNTIRSKRFPGGWIKIKGANSPKEFRRITADKVILEEVDGYPLTAGIEGDQVGLAFKRCLTSDEPLKAAGSTPTVKGTSKIEALFLQGTQEHRYVPCPCCGEMQILVFGNGTGPGIRYEPKDAPTRAWYVCVNGCVIEEDAKAGMDERGEWRAHAPQNWPHRSFHVWAGYSQFAGASWLEIAREFVTVRKDPNKLRVFVNQVLAETYEVRGEAPAWRQLYDRREDYQGVPAGGLILTGGIDVQKNRVELFVWSWGADWQCWLVDHIVIPGNPYEATVWDEVSQAIMGRWRHASGVELALAKVGADTGFATTQVEAWSRKHPGLVIPVKGATLSGRRTIQGVEFDQLDRRTGYWLFNSHPGDPYSLTAQGLSSAIVPASEVMHVYRKLRTGQVRGVPWFAPVLLKARDLDDFHEAAIVRARMEACIGMVVTQAEDGGDRPIGVSSETDGGRRVEGMEPGMVPYLKPGESVEFLNPTASPSFDPFTLHTLMAMAVGTGVTYDQMTGDLRQATYSSMRAGKVEFRRLVEQVQWQVLIPMACAPIWRRFIATAILAGQLPEGDYPAEWSPPAHEPIDPVKDMTADILAVRSGRFTWDQFVARWGYDPKQQLGEIARINGELDRLGIVLDTDPRKVSKSGGAQQGDPPNA
ncbi:phage portal protein [Azospirillum argentinense]|uniref:Phage portal protein n=1 Tax=Azospirillum brasilense TaxID=192 RepID=A0A4D8QI81_AZOBR|nr:phage portal protein [Azospirillum argentinense]QCO05452.1 phage portal protein [Azospirillum argentinense]